MKQAPAFETSSQRIRLWLMRENRDAKVYAMKGNFELAESILQASCESHQLIYDGTLEQLVEERL